MKRLISSVAVSGGMFAFLWILRLLDVVQDSLILALIGAALFFFGAVVLKVLMPRMNNTRFFSLKSMSFLEWQITLSFAILLVCGSFLLNYLSGLLYAALNVSVPDAFVNGGYSSMGVALLCIAVLPALFEELFFRGALLTTLRCARLKTPAVLAITATVFMLLHGPGWYFITDFFAGIVLALAVYFTGSLYASVMIHLLANAASYFLAHYGGRLENAGVEGLSVHVFVVCFFGAICHLLHLIKKLILRREAEDRSRVNENSRRWEEQKKAENNKEQKKENENGNQRNRNRKTRKEKSSG